jgi:hypothetical protein
MQLHNLIVMVVLLTAANVALASQGERLIVQEYNEWAARWSVEREQRLQRLERDWQEYHERQKERERRLEARLQELRD